MLWKMTTLTLTTLKLKRKLAEEELLKAALQKQEADFNLLAETAQTLEKENNALHNTIGIDDEDYDLHDAPDYFYHDDIEEPIIIDQLKK